MDQEIKQAFSDVHKKFDQKFDEAYERLDRVETKLEKLGEDIHQMGLREEHRDDILKTILDTVIRQSVERDKVEKLTSKAEDHEYRIRSLETVVTKLHDQ